MTHPGIDEVGAQRLELARRLREVREDLGLSQDEVAAVMGLSRPAISNLESGQRKVESVELDKLARLYRCSVSFLLQGSEALTEGDEKVAFLARAAKGLNEADIKELVRFADFLRNSPKNKGD